MSREYDRDLMVLEDGPMTTPEQEGSYLKGRIGRTCLER